MGLVQPTPGRGCRDGAGMAAVVEKDNRQEASRRLMWLCPDLPEQSCTFITYRRSEGPLWMVMRVPPPVHSTWQEAARSDISEWREYADAEMTWFAWSGQGRGMVREAAEQRRERKQVCVSSCAAGRGERLALGAAPPTPHHQLVLGGRIHSLGLEKPWAHTWEGSVLLQGRPHCVDGRLWGKLLPGSSLAPPRPPALRGIHS